jgi:signal transduction histidine kinase
LKRVKWVFYLVNFFYFCLLHSLQIAQATDSGLLTLNKAWVVLKPTGQPTEIVLASLPHRWDKHYKVDGAASYFIELPVLNEKQGLKAKELVGFYIPRLGNQAMISLNDEVIANFGDFDKPDADWSKAPIWVSIPAALASRTINHGSVLRIDTNIQRGRWGGLSPISYGWEHAVKPSFNINFFFRVTANLVIGCAYIFMGLMVFALWVKQHTRLHGLFVCATIFAVIRIAGSTLVNPLFDTSLWAMLSASAIGILILFINAFCLELIERLNTKTILCLTALAVVTMVSVFVSQRLYLPWIWTSCLAMYAVPSLWTFYLMQHTYQQQKTNLHLFLLLAIGFVVCIGLRDWVFLRLRNDADYNHPYLPISMFVFVILMAHIVVLQYNKSFNQAKQLTLHLHEEILQKELEIKLAYKAISQQEQEKAALLERQRMMIDIHDGVGAQLVSLVNQTQKPQFDQIQVREQASSALDELRMAVDALQPSEGDLLLVLATLRYRLEPRLKACGIRLEWQMQPLPNVTQLGSHQVLQIQRIVYQAISNIIEHSQASVVTISTHALPASIVITIRDNGIGFNTRALNPSHSQAMKGVGLQSMAHRAKDIGAALNIRSAAGETVVELLVQL